MGQAVPTLSVLAGDEVPSLLGAGIRVEGFGGREVGGPKPVGSVISQHNEELQEESHGHGEHQGQPGGAGCLVSLHPRGDRGAAALPGEAAWPLRMPCQPRCLYLHDFIGPDAGVKLQTLHLGYVGAQAAMLACRRVSTP